MASSATCPESKKKKLSNVLSNATADMLESHYDITVPDHMKDYRVVIQSFNSQWAIIGAKEITKESKFIFYDPNNKKDQDGHIIFYNRKGKIINSIKIKSIEDSADCKKLKIVKGKAYKEEAIPAKYSEDELGKLNGSYSYDKLILLKQSTIHHIKKCKPSNPYYDSPYYTPIAEFIGNTLFNAALKKAGLSKLSTEYTIVRDEGGQFYFDSTDARKGEPWIYQAYINHMDLNLFKAIIIAHNLQVRDIGTISIYSRICLTNILQFIDDKNVFHHKIIDLGQSLHYLHQPEMRIPNLLSLVSWYNCYLLNKDEFTSVECRDAILEGFRVVSELDILGELEAIEPVLKITKEFPDIKQMSKIITDNLNISCSNIKDMICIKDKYTTIPIDGFFIKCMVPNPCISIDLTPKIRDKWELFCQETNLKEKASELSEELKRKYSEKQSTSLAAATESKTMYTTDTYRPNEQGSQQV